MAEERDLELLDNYLANRMSAEERSTFELRLNGDPSLQNEYDLQKQVVEIIRQARAAELKAMLNKVPVPSQGNSVGTKLTVGVAVVFIAAGAMWYLNQNQDAMPASVEAPIREPVRVEKPVEEQPTSTAAEQSVEPAREQPSLKKAEAPRHTPEVSVQPDKNQTSAGTEDSRPSLAQKPVPPAGPARRSLRVVAVGESKNTFHYQYEGNLLYLHGPFDSSAYSVINVGFERGTTPVLKYNDTFYLLDERDGAIHPLEPVTDVDDLEKIHAAQ